MGFGGAAMAMITSLKNNNRRKHRKAFEKMGEYAGYGIGTYNKSSLKFKKATKAQLQAIRIRLAKEKKQLFLKRLIAVIMIPVSVIALFKLLM